MFRGFDVEADLLYVHSYSISKTHQTKSQYQIATTQLAKCNSPSENSLEVTTRYIEPVTIRYFTQVTTRYCHKQTKSDNSLTKKKNKPVTFYINTTRCLGQIAIQQLATKNRTHRFQVFCLFPQILEERCRTSQPTNPNNESTKIKQISPRCELQRKEFEPIKNHKITKNSSMPSP